MLMKIDAMVSAASRGRFTITVAIMDEYESRMHARQIRQAMEEADRRVQQIEAAWRAEQH